MGYSSIFVGFFSVAIEVSMIFLNLLFLYSCGYEKSKRDKSEIDDILMSHSACTICFILFSTPFGLMTYFIKHNDALAETCALYQVSTTWYQILCLFIISCLALNCVKRGYALTQSKFQHRIWTKLVTCILCVFSFIVSLNVSVLPIFGLAPEIKNFTDSNITCHLWISAKPETQKDNTFSIVFLVIGYIHALCLLICKPVIFRYIRKVKRQLYIDLCSCESNFLLERDIIRRRFIDASKMISLVAAMFYFSWIPNLAMVTLDKVGHNISETAILYAMLGTTLTGLLNPLAYAYWDKSYRNGYKKAMKRLFNLCTCKRLMQDNTPVVVLQTANIAQSAEYMNAANEIYPKTSDVMNVCDSIDHNVVNPTCQDNRTETSDRNITAEASLVTSLSNAVAAITLNQETIDGSEVYDTYSVNSESEIFMTEHHLDILEEDDRRFRHKEISDTSDSSQNTDNDSFVAFDGNDNNDLDESIM